MHAEVHEASGDRLEASRLRRDVGIFGDIGPVDDLGYQRERRVAAKLSYSSVIVSNEHLPSRCV